MANLLASLLSATSTMDAFSRVLDVVQNNVSNASTPGFAKQKLDLYAMPFSGDSGPTGGARAGTVQSTRDEYSEQAVRRQLTAQGGASQTASSLTAIEAAFDVSSNAGLSGAMSQLFESFSAWSVDSGNTLARQNVLNQAGELAKVFHTVALDVSGTRHDTEGQIQDTVAEINRLTVQMRDLNREIRLGNKDDPSVDARMHNTLDDLSKLAEINAVRSADGSYTVMLAGQALLVTGNEQFNLSARFSQPADPPPVYENGPPHVAVFDSVGRDITAVATGGKLGSLLDMRNRVIPSILGDAYQPGDLNRLAKELAGQVNSTLTSGNITDGPPAEAGVPLFSYDPANDTNVAQTLAVDPAVSTGSLAAIDPGPPYVSNGIPLRLAALASRQGGGIDGFSYAEFYGNITSRVGTELATARQSADYQTQAAIQAQDIRKQISGVSLDEEAALLVEFQRAYQANARLVTVIDQLTQEVLNILK
jgi:flagellar hook-associated protein 1 FlgK